MRKRRLSLPTVITLSLLLIMLLFVAVIVLAVVLQPSADPPVVIEPPPVVEETPVQPSPSPEPPPPPEPEPPVEEEPEEPPVEEPPRVIESLAARMRIPALSLDYEVQSLGADETGTMLIAPALEIISWFDRSAIPGNEGNAIFGGHNLWNGVRSRIYTLDELEIGDELEIEYEDGSVLRFYMESVFVYELKTAPAHLIMDTKGESRLTLITCKPPFNPSTGTSDNRIVAIFKEEGVFEIPDPPIEKYPPKED